MIQMTYLWRYEDVLERLGERAVDFFSRLFFVWDGEVCLCFFLKVSAMFRPVVTTEG